jgi:hypothetical protein
MFALCYWPAPLGYVLYLRYTVLLVATGPGLVYGLWRYTEH